MLQVGTLDPVLLTNSVVRKVADSTLPTVISSEWLGLFNRKLLEPSNQTNERVMTKIKFTTVILAALLAGVAQPTMAQNYSTRVSPQIAPGPRLDANTRQHTSGGSPLSEYASPPAPQSPRTPQSTFRPLPHSSQPVRPVQQTRLPVVQQQQQVAVPQHVQQPRSFQPYQPATQPNLRQVAQQVPARPVSQPIQHQVPEYVPTIPAVTTFPSAPPVQRVFTQPQPQYAQPQPQLTPVYAPQVYAQPQYAQQQFLPTVLDTVPAPQMVEEVIVGNDFFEPVETLPPIQTIEAPPTTQQAIEQIFSGKKGKKTRGLNRIVGVNVQLLSREHFNDGVNIGTLSSGSVTQQDAVGFDANIVTRREGGTGWEARYFGMFEETATATSGASGGPFMTFAANDLITRVSEIDNVEFNFVRQRKSRFLGMPVSNNESIYGARAFHFRESLNYQANPAFVVPNPLTDTFPRAENLLIGVQVGRRVDKQIHGRIGITGFAKLGVFTNRAEIQNQTFSDRKQDVSFIGEGDVAGTFQFNRFVRAKVGYRAIAVTDLALADTHLNTDPFTPFPTEIDTDGDLFLAGGYFGLEFVH